MRVFRSIVPGPPRGLLVLVLFAGAAPLGAAPRSGETEFQRAYAVVRELAGVRRWSSVGQQLDQLLAEHERQPYVLPHLAEIVDLYERCAFFADYRTPSASQLVSGTLESWDPDSGRVALRYDELPGDFEPSGGAWLHPIEFIGPHRITLEGRLPATTPGDGEADPIQLLVGITRDTSHQVVVGSPRHETSSSVRWVSPVLIENGPDGSAVVAERDETPLRRGEPFRVEVRIAATTLTATVDGELLFRVNKPRDRYGRMALVGLRGIESVTLAGHANPGWLVGMADTRAVREREAFRLSWNPEQRVPRWVLDALPRRRSGPARPSLSFQRNVANEQIGALERLSELYTSGETARGLAEAEALSRRELADEYRHFFRGLFLLDAGRPREAEVAFGAATDAAPDFVEARALRGRALGRAGRVDDALEVLRAIVSEEPSAPLAWSECARWCLVAGRPNEARSVLDRALVLGVPADDLADVQSVLVRALSGPMWERTHEYESAHYLVRSDLGRQVCFDAARELEAARRLYEHRLGRLERRRRGSAERSPVYVFAGRAGYDAYGRDALGLAPDTTVGAFSSELGQLLVWSPPDRADMLRTLRHEGLHQYLDEHVGAVPVWLNEGLAEYFENTATERGRPVDGAPQPGHVATLLGRRWVPFEELFAMGPEPFYADAELHYAQSWAVVHWLQKSGLAAGRVFQALLDDLSSGADAAAIAARVLDAGDLEEQVGAHLDQL